jgi:hypothetical protein
VTVDSAGGIGLVEGGENPFPHAEAQCRCGPVEGRRLSEHDPVVEDPRIGVGGDPPERERADPQHRSDCKSDEPALHGNPLHEGAI